MSSLRPIDHNIVAHMCPLSPFLKTELLHWKAVSLLLVWRLVNLHSFLLSLRWLVLVTTLSQRASHPFSIFIQS